MKVIRLSLALLLVLWPVAVFAADVTPHRVHIKVAGTDGYPVAVAEIGCAWSDYPAPTNYESVVSCYDCYEALCVFPEDDMHAVEGGYIVSADFMSLNMIPPSAVWGQMYPGGEQQTFGMWYTNEAAEDFDWEDIHAVIFTVNDTAATPTPVPTLTPFPTPTVPATPDLSEGFGAGFDDTFGTLSGSGALPPFSLDVNVWLFYGRKVIQMINRGNLLFVMGGILMAGLVLGWAIDQVKNPR